MYAILAEKPSAAKAFAAALNGKKEGKVYIVPPSSYLPEGGIICHAVGHVIEFLEPQEYDEKYKEYSLEHLPIIPTTWKYKVSDGKQDVYSTIKKTLLDKRVKSIILGTDCAAEGEYIGRSIIYHMDCHKPIKRLWVSSMTKAAIQKAFMNLLDGEQTIKLYDQAHARAKSDYMIGLSLSRAYSYLLKQEELVLKKTPISIGRCQTPLLAEIVKKERQIEQFIPKDYWGLDATFQSNGVLYSGSWFHGKEDRLYVEQQADTLSEWAMGKDALIISCKEDRKTFKPPQLYNLSDLQIDVGNKYGLKPDDTSKICQTLYDKGFLSYPRTADNLITENDAVELEKNIQLLQAEKHFVDFFPLPKQTLIGDKRYVGEVTDHHALLMTERIPSITELTKDEANIYQLVVNRIIAAHYPDMVGSYQELVTLVGDKFTFRSKGKQVLSKGWHSVLPPESEKDSLLPNTLQEGSRSHVEKVDKKKSQTKPPNRYTSASLISFMKNTNPINQDDGTVMKQVELGTESTRANFIVLLEKRGYIRWEQKKVYATDIGKLLIDSIKPSSVISSAILTAKWDEKLKEVGQGNYKGTAFTLQSQKLAHVLVDEIKSYSRTWELKKVKDVKEEPLGSCLVCGGDVVPRKGKNGSFYGCSNFKENACTFTLPNIVLKKKLTKRQLMDLLEKQKTSKIKGFHYKDKTFDSHLVWNAEEKKIEFQR